MSNRVKAILTHELYKKPKMKWIQKDNIDEIYLDAVNGRLPLNGNECPNCADGKLHIFVQVFDDEKSEGQDWIKGSGWIWCDKCHCWDHFRGHVAKAWKNAPKIEIDTLDLPPEKLSIHEKDIDERNKLIFK